MVARQSSELPSGGELLMEKVQETQYDAVRLAP